MTMLAYDVHHHLWPEPFLAALAHRERPPRLRGNTLELETEPPLEIDLGLHTLESRIAQLDRDGIDVAVISLPPTMETEAHEDLREAYHEGILELVAAAGGRLVALACDARLDGFAGACISAQRLVQGAEPLLTELEEAGQMLFVHPGLPAPRPRDAPPWWNAIVDYTAQMQAAYAAWLARDAVAHPRLPVVFAILAGGAPIQLERLRSRGVEVRTTLHPNGYFDAASYGRRALELCMATYGVTQLLYGSDAPVIDPRDTLAAIQGFGETVAGLVLRDNPARILE